MEKIILFILGLLLFILPMEHTIAIRYILSIILLLITLFTIIKLKIHLIPIFKIKEVKIVTYLLLFLTLWIFVEIVFISHFKAISFNEFRSQWIYPILFFYIGIFLSKIITYQKFLLIVVLAIFIHILYIDLDVLNNFIHTHHLISRVKGLTDGSDKSNYLTNLLLAFLITEVIFRLKIKKQFLVMDNWFLSILIALTLFSSVVEGMRNGVVAILFLSSTAIIVVFYKNQDYSKKFKIIFSILTIILLSIPASYNFIHDKRWQTLKQTIPIALNTAKYTQWLHASTPLPKLPNGTRVGDSNYKRIAFMKMGIIEILKHPFGVGYGRNSFKHALELDYSNVRVGHSHSSIIDFTLGVGIIGLMLWIGFILYLLYLSVTIFKKYNSFFSILLFFNITGFFIRSLVDSNMRDHMFLMFMIIIGMLFMYMIKEKNEKATNLRRLNEFI